MKMLIDKLKLNLLLEKKRDYIKKSVDGVDVVITAVIYIISLLCSDFKSVFGIDKEVIATVAYILAFIILVYGARRIYISSKYKYNHNILLNDIENLDEVLHKFSIVALKDDFNDHSNRFLLYYDDAWKCWFFFNFKTSEAQNEENLAQRLSNMLKIDVADIRIKYITDRIQPKFSERDQVNKVYQHSLYQAQIFKFGDILKEDEFEIEGVRFKWFTIADMEKNERIKSINSDVVAYVKEKIN